jgi:uncharacterized protein YecE (DUF72 family)
MIHLGTSGWSYDAWVGKFYPDDLKKRDWLGFYSKKFNTVEVNASFYRLPFKNMVKGWKDKTPKDFLLTFKGSNLITHKKKLKDVDEYLDKFYSRFDMLEDKKGVVLWQLPPSLKRDDALFENFLNSLNSDVDQVFEFRHKSWFDDKIYSLLEDYNVGFCIVDSPDINTDFVVTSDFAYIRWHGKNDWYKHDYSKEYLEKWAEKIKDSGVKDVYGYFNNDYKGFAPKNCKELKDLLK